MGRKTISWDECIYSHLVEFGRNIDFYDDKQAPLTLKTITLGITLAQDFYYFNAPEPNEIYVDFYGGIVFEREVRDKKVVVTVLPNESIEYLGLGFPLGARRKIISRCKTGDKDYWTEWIKEAQKTK
jgi:hypothetical protein